MIPTMTLLDHMHSLELLTGIDTSEMSCVAVVVPPAKILRELVDGHGQRLYIIRKPPVGGVLPLANGNAMNEHRGRGRASRRKTG